MPILTILTNVSLDHTGILGDSIEQIAWEKAGIAKRAVPLLGGRLAPEAEVVAKAACEEAGGAYLDASDVEVRPLSEAGGLAQYAVDAAGLPNRLELGLLGGYQSENLRVVLRAAQLLREHGLALPSSAVERGLRDVRWPGRFEFVRRSPDVVLDGAHNVAGAVSLAEEVARRFPERSGRHLILGVLADKDVDGIVSALVPLFDDVVLTQSSSPRALSAEELAGHVDGCSLSLRCYDSVAAALDATLRGERADDVWVVAGSLTVVAEARRVLEGGR